MTLRLAFMGSPAFAVPALRALHAAGHDIACVYSQPPRPSGRGHAVSKSPVHVAAESLGLPVRTPVRLRKDEGEQAGFASLQLDAAVVAAYGLILPEAMLAAPRLGCMNIHASLLPRWRGAAPIQAAILAGDEQTGITLMRMEVGLDTGPIYASAAVPIGARTTTPELHEALAALGAGMVVQALEALPDPVPQPQTGVTYAAKLTRADGALDWRRDADALDRQVRALNPWPGTFATLGEETIKILTARPVAASGAAGHILDADFTVACGAGALRLERVQKAGRPATGGAEFLRGAPGFVGARFRET